MSTSNQFFGGGGSYAPQINELQAQAVNQSNSNIIINGDFSIDQRGNTSSSTSGECIVDRWKQFIGLGAGTASGGYTKDKEAVGTELRTVLTHSVQISGGNGTEVVGVCQRLEDLSRFSGKTITLSFDAKGSVSGEITVGLHLEYDSSTPDVLNSSAKKTITTEWKRYYVTLTVNDLTSVSLGVGSALAVWFLKQTGAGAWADSKPTLWGESNLGGDLSISNVKLEWGDVATPFTPDNPDENLAKCQRYYELGNWRWRVVSGGDATVVGGYVNFAVRKRTESYPTILNSAQPISDSVLHADGMFLETTSPASGNFTGTWAVDAEL